MIDHGELPWRDLLKRAPRWPDYAHSTCCRYLGSPNTYYVTCHDGQLWLLALEAFNEFVPVLFLVWYGPHMQLDNSDQSRRAELFPEAMMHFLL